MKLKVRAQRSPGSAPRRPAPVPSGSEGMGDGHPLETLQRTIGNEAVTGLVQRGGGEAGAPARREILSIFGVELTTYQQVAWHVKLFSGELKTDIAALKGKGLSAPASVADAIAEGFELADLLEGGGTEPLDEGLRQDYFGWEDRFVAARRAMRETENAEAARRLRAIEKKAKAFVDQIRTKLMPILREGQRAAFRAGDESLLGNLAETVSSAANTVSSFTGVAEKAATVASELMTLSDMPNFGKGMGSAASALEKVNGVLDKATDAYEKLKLMAAAIQVLTGSPVTEAEGAREAVGFAVDVSTTLLGAVRGADAVFGHIGPMTEACLKKIGQIEDLISGQNRAAIEVGMEDYVNWNVEPGGYDMYVYMKEVMKANSRSGVPTPTGDVAEYLLDHEDAFGAGVGSAGGDVPTEGWIFKDLDESKIQSWVYRNRRTIWAMLYGNMGVPR